MFLHLCSALKRFGVLDGKQLQLIKGRASSVTKGTHTFPFEFEAVCYFHFTDEAKNPVLKFTQQLKGRSENRAENSKFLIPDRQLLSSHFKHMIYPTLHLPLGTIKSILLQKSE